MLLNVQLVFARLTGDEFTPISEVVRPRFGRCRSSSPRDLREGIHHCCEIDHHHLDSLSCCTPQTVFVAVQMGEVEAQIMQCRCAKGYVGTFNLQ